MPIQILLLGLAILAASGVGIWLWRRTPANYSQLQTLDEAATGTLGSAAVAPMSSQVTAPLALHVPGPREVLDQLYAVAFDDARLAPPDPSQCAAQAQVVQQAVAILAAIEAQPRYTPRRPVLLPQLMQTLRDDHSSLRAISRIIAQDPALTGNLLRIANSSLYRVSPVAVENIERAIALIGTEGLRSIITAALLQPVLTGGSGPFARFPEIIWEHALLAASAAETHAATIEKSDSAAAQLLGLLHGLGAIIVFRVTRDQYNAWPGVALDASVIAELLEAQAAPTAGRIAASWQLSERIGTALQEQTQQSNPELLSSLGHSLRFGRLAGALIMLCKLGRLSEAQARAALLASEPDVPQLQRIWERMVQAHRLANAEMPPVPPAP